MKADCQMFLVNLVYQKAATRGFLRKVLRNFAKFTGKDLCQSFFFDKVAGLRPATLLKMRLWHRCFPVNYAKFLRTPFFIKDLWWMLLYICFSDLIYQEY